MKRSLKCCFCVNRPRVLVGMLILLCSLVVSVCIFCFSYYSQQACEKAYSLDSTTANTTYENAVATLDKVKAEYDAQMQIANDLQNQIDAATASAFQAQNEMIRCQENLRNLATYEYRNNTIGSLVNLVFQSSNFEEFSKNIDYANYVMGYQADLSNKQKQRKAEFDSIVDDLTQKSDAQKKAINEAAKKQNEAVSVVNAASLNLTAAQTAELTSKIGGGGDSGGGTSGGSSGGGGSGGGGGPEPSPEPEPPGPSGSWSVGVASAYGGSSDPSTPNPGRTATGDICDDWSTGVAVPMAWPNYRSYFRHTVKIRYGGMTVLATINDCGYMGGGARSLDLQPGVFKAFGFSTCRGWGLRTVEYQIL